MKGNGCLSELEYADNAITGASVAVLERRLAQGPMYLERYVLMKYQYLHQLCTSGL